MALLKYLTLKQREATKNFSEYLPDPSGPLALAMPSSSITAANSSVAKVLESTRNHKRKPKSHTVNTEHIRLKREQR